MTRKKDKVADPFEDEVSVAAKREAKARRAKVEPILAAWSAFECAPINLHLVDENGKPHDVTKAIARSFAIFATLSKAIEGSGVDVIAHITPSWDTGADALNILAASPSDMNLALTAATEVKKWGIGGTLGQTSAERHWEQRSRSRGWSMRKIVTPPSKCWLTYS